MSWAAAVPAFLDSSGFERANTATLSQIRARSKMSTVTIDWVPMRRDPLPKDRGRPLLRTGHRCRPQGVTTRIASEESVEVAHWVFYLVLPKVPGRIKGDWLAPSSLADCWRTFALNSTNVSPVRDLRGFELPTDDALLPFATLIQSPCTQQFGSRSDRRSRRFRVKRYGE